MPGLPLSQGLTSQAMEERRPGQKRSKPRAAEKGTLRHTSQRMELCRNNHTPRDTHTHRGRHGCYVGAEANRRGAVGAPVPRPPPQTQINLCMVIVPNQYASLKPWFHRTQRGHHSTTAPSLSPYLAPRLAPALKPNSLYRLTTTGLWFQLLLKIRENRGSAGGEIGYRANWCEAAPACVAFVWHSFDSPCLLALKSKSSHAAITPKPEGFLDENGQEGPGTEAGYRGRGAEMRGRVLERLRILVR